MNSYIIMVFRLNGRPYFYSSVSFSLLLLRSSVSNGRPYCYSSVSFSLLLLFFILLDFSKTPRRIFMKFSGMVYIGLERLKIIFRVMTSLPVWDIDDFLILRVSFCAWKIFKTTQDIFFKFSRKIDKGMKFIPIESQVYSSKSAEAR